MEKLKSFFTKQGSISFVLCLVIVLVLSFSTKIFWSEGNIQSLQASIAPTAIVAFGMVMLLICGVFDLSVGSIMVLSGIICGKMFEANMPIPLVLIAGLLVGAFVGFLNGLFVGVLKINPLIATIGTMNIASGIAMVIFASSHKGQAEYQTVIKLPENFINIGTGKFLGMYYMFWAMLILVIAVTIFQRYAPVGRQMYLLGDNLQAAKMMGFKTTRILIYVYIFTGLLCAIAGIFSVARSEQANRYLGEGINIMVIISCILGGASFVGGRGSAIGSLFGVILMLLITDLINLFGVQSAWQNVVVGSILIAVITIDGYIIMRKKRELGKI